MSFLKKIFSKKDTLSDQRIIVFGDSHSRAFSLNPNFFPIFLGAGKKNNFINEENYDLVKNSVFKALGNIENKYIMFCLGEPDTRYYLGLGWYPWEGKREFELADFRPNIGESFSRYIKLLHELKREFDKEFIVFNITPSMRIDQNKMVNYYNKLLKDASVENDYTFIDINEKIYSNNESIIDQQYYSDTVHLNTRVQILVEDFLIKKGFVTTKGFDKEIDISAEQLQAKYKYDKRFGCYVLK